MRVLNSALLLVGTKLISVVKLFIFFFLFLSVQLVQAQTTSTLAAGVGTQWVNSSGFSTNGGSTIKLGLGVEYLIVAGGGGGGNGWHGGGGGGGGLISGSTALGNTNHSIVVGSGGSGGGYNGSNSTAFGFTAIGGGGGANGGSGSGRAGGSGGGASYISGGTGTSSGGAGTSGQGYNGGSATYQTNVYGSGAGGGGAGGLGGSSYSGSTAGAGGIGSLSEITGTPTRYAAGGGGNGANGGTGGGGSAGGQGTDGLGGGGSGPGGPSTGGRGGSGVVIFRYLSQSEVTSGGSLSSISNSLWKVVRFTTNGTLSVSVLEADLISKQTGVISGTGSLTYDSPGTLSLEAANTYTGYTYSKSGTLNLAHINAIQNSTLDLRSTDVGAIGFTLAGSNTYNLGGLAGSRNLNFGANILSIGGNNESTIFSGVLSGGGGIIKTGTGVLSLSANNLYTGNTTISGGVLELNGNLVGTGDVFVESGAKIQGSGSINGVTTIKNNGNIQPGNSIGKITINNKLNLQGGGNYNFQISDPNGSAGTNGWDLIDVNGTLEITSTTSSKFNINLWTILNANGNVSGNLANFNPLNKYTWEIFSADIISGFDASKFSINSSAINGTGGFQSSILATGSFKIEQSGNSLMLVYYPATDQTIDGIDNIVKTTTYTTNTITNRLNLKLGVLVDYLLVAGGGAGGGGKNSNPGGGGGGGGGGMLSGKIELDLINYNLTVGAGGTATGAQGNNGGNSTAFGLTAIGGGGGAGEYSGWPGGSGGSGGGQGGNGGAKGTGTLGQGNDGGSANGGSGGGGGGAGTIGSTASGSTGGAGGAGRSSNITGSSIMYAGGGGGATSSNGTGGVPGTGGGVGGSSSSRNGGSGVANTGGGGGGAAGNSSGSTGTAGRGGSGVIIARYIRDEPLSNIGGAVNSFTENGVVYQVHTFNSSGNFNLSSIIPSAVLNSAIIGSGDLSFAGPGILILNADNTYSGTTSVANGTLQIGNGGTIGTISNNSISVAAGATLVFNKSNTYTLGNANVISGSGIVEQASEGTLDLGGITTHAAGTWKLSAGNISNGTLSSGNFSLTEGTITAILAGSGTLSKTGDGMVTLSGNNTFSGTTSISGGTLVVNGTNSGTGAVTVSTGATLKGSGTIGGATTIQSGGTLHPGNGVGTMTFSDRLTLSGGGNLNWQVNNATGTAGINWGSVNVAGALTINATSGNKFNINIWSVLASGENGFINNFKPTENTYSWTILTAGSISGFNVSAFQINLEPTNGTGGLNSPYKVNGFTIVQDGNSLKLVYSPPTQQTINGTNNGIESANFTTTTSAGSLTLDLGFFVDHLIVAGGGGGGGDNGGGGGGGGVLAGYNKQVSATSYVVTIGAGGAGGAVNVRGSNGSNSSLFGLTAVGGGGGGGGNSGQTAQAGGSGGGGDGETSFRFGSAGTSIQGFKGGNGSTGGGGGGGGAGGIGLSAIGPNGGNGGAGIANEITGSVVYYGGGGGGGPENLVNYISSGGNGGGGAGKLGLGNSGTANTGGGGGGAGWSGSQGTGGAGGSGVAIIRYAGSSLGSSIGGTVTAGSGSATGYTIHTFNASGSFNMSGVSLDARLRATLSGNIIGNGNLIYNSDGRLTLTGTNHTYTGVTTIQKGELSVNSSIMSSSGVTVNATGKLSGTGTLPATTINGTHAPGSSPGIQTINGNLTYNTGATFQWELIANDETAADRGVDFDGVNMTTGTLSIGTGVSSALIFNGTGSAVDFTNTFWKTDHKWLVFDNGGAPTLSSATNIFDNVSVTADKNGKTLSSVLPNARFFWTKEGDDIYLNYDSRTPELTVSPETLQAMSTCVGTASATQTFTVSGQYLLGNVTVTAPTGFAVSLNGTSYAPSQTITPSSGSISSTTIHVRLTGATAGNITGSINVSTTGISDQTVSVTGTVYTLPAITVQPSSTSQTICQNGTATALSVTATGDGLTYQWYSNTTNSNTGGTLISGATSNTYTPLTNTVGTVYYYCVVGGECSSSVKTTVSGAIIVRISVGGTVSGSSSVCTGTNSTTLTLSGHTGSIQWQSSADNVTYTNINGATTTTYTPTNLTSTTYYRAVVTNGSCSSATSTVGTITVQSNSVGGSVAGSATVCTGTNSTVLILSGYTGSVVKWQVSTSSNFSSGVTDISHTGSTYTATNLTATRYYRAVVQNGVCASANSAAATVTVSGNSVGGTATASVTSLCAGSNATTLTLSGSTGSNQWQSSSDGTNYTDISGASATTYNATDLPATMYYRARVTNGVCSTVNSTAVTITVNAKPTATISYNSPSFCPTGTAAVTLTGQTSGSFSSTSGLSINNSTGAIDLSQSIPGTYTVTYTFTNGAGCTNTTTTSITINNVPTSPAVTAGGAATTICEGASVALSASAQTSGTISNYQWYKDNAIINGITGNTYAAGASGSYTIKAVDVNGCVSTESAAVSVTVNPNPQATITQGSLLTFSNCSGGGSVTLTASSGSSYQWRLNGSNITGATSSTYSTATAGDYSVVITNASGCVSTSAITKVVSAPTVYSSSSTICAGQSTTLNGTGYTLQSGESYRWEYTAAGGNSWSAASGTNTNNTYTATTAGDYRLAIINTADQTTKSTSCPVSVVVNPLPSIGSISSDATICAGQQTTLSVSTSTTNPGYQWFNNGVSLDGSTAASYTASTAGSYTVNITDANGCSTTSNAVVVSVTSLPDAPSGATGASICGTGNATVSFSSPTSAVYNWYAAATGGTKMNSNASASYTANGISSTTVYYAATVSNGCESITRSAVTATVNPLPTASINYGGTPYCPVGTAVVTQTGQAGGTYTSTTGLVINANTGAIDLAQSTPGTYTVTYSFSDGNCSNTTTTSIVIEQPVAAPTVSASGATDICDGGSVVLTSSTGTSYQWYKDGVAINTNGTSSSYTSTSAGSYYVKISSGSCQNIASSAVLVTIKPLPIITTIPNVVICEGSSAALSASGASSYSWAPGTGLSATNVANPTVSATSTTTYTVTGTGANGCTNTATTIVTVNAIPAVTAITGSSSCAVGSTIQLSNTTSGGSWTSSDPNIASVSSTGIVTGVAAGSAVITYRVTNANGCTNSATITLTISASPTIIVTGTLNAFSACVGSISSIQSIVVEGSNLTNDIIITAPTGYKVSSDNTTYTTSITLPQTNGTVHLTTVYVKLSGIGINSGNYNGVISISSTNATTQTLSVSGMVYASPTISTAGADLLSIPTLSKSLGANTPTSGTGAWSIVSGPNTNTSQFSSITSNISSFTPTAKGNYVLRWTISSGTCTSSTDDVTVRVVDDIWLGTTSSDWNDPTNWASGTVPGGAGVDLVLDPTSTRDLTLSGDLSIGSLDFNGANVKLVLGNNDLTIGSITGASSTSYVQTNGDGLLNMTIPNGGSKLFPIGTSSYSPVTLTNNTGTSDVFYASVSDGVFTNGGTSGTSTYASPRVDLTWKIGNTSGNTGSGSVDLMFGWDATKEIGTPVSPKLFRHDGTSWFQQSGTPVVDLNANTLSYTGFTGNFSTFSIAENNAALPVTWISFRARRVNHSVMLEWATAAEWNNAFYEIERSNDGFRFTKIGKVKAAVNSRTRNDYSFSDDLPLAGKSFYRLRQVDVDGKFSYSSVVKMEGLVPAIKTWTIPGSGKLNVWVPETIKGKLTLVILDVTGRVYYQEAVGAGVTAVNIDQLKATGVYFIKLLNDGIQIFSSKIMN